MGFGIGFPELDFVFVHVIGWARFVEWLLVDCLRIECIVVPTHPFRRHRGLCRFDMRRTLDRCRCGTNLEIPV
jgi:hypothetical protein